MNASTAETGARAADRRSQMEAIVAEHETALLRYAARILNNPFAAQDVVQNVFIKLFKRWKKGMRPSRQLQAWLYRVAHNEAVDHIRRESRRRLLHEKHAEQETLDCDDKSGAADDTERRELVLRHLRRLQPREQQVVLLRLQEGLPYREIARITGRTEGNVGNILHHAVRRLAVSLRAER